MANPIRKISQAPKPVVDRLASGRNTTFQRFPLLFTLMGTFGVVATLYGFEGMINKIDFFTDKPYIVLITGVITLWVTGTLYKKL